MSPTIMGVTIVLRDFDVRFKNWDEDNMSLVVGNGRFGECPLLRAHAAYGNMNLLRRKTSQEETRGATSNSKLLSRILRSRHHG